MADAVLQYYRRLSNLFVADRRGRIVKNTGDGALVEFGSIVDAVRCAVEIQRVMAEQNIEVPQVKRIEYRIGIHVGDIINADDDIFGDGVNMRCVSKGSQNRAVSAYPTTPTDKFEARLISSSTIWGRRF